MSWQVLLFKKRCKRLEPFVNAVMNGPTESLFGLLFILALFLLLAFTDIRFPIGLLLVVSGVGGLLYLPFSSGKLASYIWQRKRLLIPVTSVLAGLVIYGVCLCVPALKTLYQHASRL